MPYLSFAAEAADGALELLSLFLQVSGPATPSPPNEPEPGSPQHHPDGERPQSNACWQELHHAVTGGEEHVPAMPGASKAPRGCR